MKILIVRTHPTEIKIKTYNVQELGLAKALISLGHQCDIMLYTDSESHTEDISVFNRKQIRIYWTHGKNFLWQGIYNWKNLLDLASTYDYVQVNEYNQIASFYITKMLPGKSYIYHGPYYNPKDRKYNSLNRMFDSLFLNKMIKQNPLVFAKSDMAEISLREKGFQNVFTVGVGLDTGRFDNSEEDNEKSGMNCQYNLLYIGEISERRNTLFLIDVFHEVNNRLNSKARLRIIGKCADEYTNKVKKRVNEYKLQHFVEFIDRKEQIELPEEYSRADLFVFPTNYDIFGMVLLEALYFGVPVVSSRNGGSATLLDDGKCGCIVDTFDITKWTSTIITILNDKQRMTDMGLNGKRRICESFTWEAIARKMLETIDRKMK